MCGANALRKVQEFNFPQLLLLTDVFPQHILNELALKNDTHHPQSQQSG